MPWALARLSSVGIITGGGTPKTEIKRYWSDGTIPWFTPAEMRLVNGLHVNSSARRITEDGLRESSAKIIKKGSLILSSRAPIGYLIVSDVESTTSQGCKSFTPKDETIDADYVMAALQSIMPVIISKASGTTFKEISGKEVGGIVIPIPPALEQQRIKIRLRMIANALK